MLHMQMPHPAKTCAILVSSINNHDVPIVEGVVLVFALVVVVAALAADLLYAVLDPRIRYERSAS